MRPRLAILLAALVLATGATPAQEVRIGIFGLFHPSDLVVQSQRGQFLSVKGTGTEYLLNGERLHKELRFHAERGSVAAGGHSAAKWTIQARDGKATRIQVGVPGKIRRTFTGTVRITAIRNELIATVAMDRETAVASIVAAEMPVDAPVEALKAQAVVTRSFLVSSRRHKDFDFCDTTHCQYLRSSDEVTAPVADAVAATHGIVIAYQQRSVAAMYSSRCGGATQSLRDAGADPGEGYPYYAVECAWCRRHPLHWTTRVDPAAARPANGNEAQRIIVARQWGWSAIPGNQFTVESDAHGLLINGRSVGHSIGMCQLGAMGMAREGADYRTILAHYYPNTELTTMQ